MTVRPPLAPGAIDFFAAWREWLTGMADPRLDPARDLAYWAEAAPECDSWPSQACERILATVCARVQPGDSVLDVGGGTGRFALPLAKRCRSVTLLDASGPMLHQARQKASRDGLANLVFVESDWDAACVPRHDVVIVAWSLYRELDLERCLARLLDATRRELVIIAPDADASQDRRGETAAYLYVLGGLRQLGVRATVDVVLEPVPEGAPVPVPNRVVAAVSSALPRLLLAAPMSGSGKTTVTAGLIAALRGRGVAVAPFKCGPDYIDPGYHSLAAGRPCANLDSWLIPPDQVAGVLSRRAAGADLALIEGVMGLFDGRSGDTDEGSSADIARLTGTPVVVVLDVRGMARTAAAIVAGLRALDPRVNVAGVILNRAGSARHAALAGDAITAITGVPVLGYVPRDASLVLPERHLGLVPVAEPGRWDDWLARVASTVARTVDLDRLLAIAATAGPLDAPGPPLASSSAGDGEGPLIAVARDEAFSFLYEDNLDLLRAAGARLAFFSPLRDADLPPGSAGLYLCGGFPEVYASALSANTGMLQAVRAAARTLPVYAECGGLMYLSRSIVAQDGQVYPMAGVLPGRSTMAQRVTLGYRTACAVTPTWLFAAGEEVRGHEFHYSTFEPSAAIAPAYELLPATAGAAPQPEGVAMGNVVASYVHVHFLSAPHLATRFVAAARAAPRATPASPGPG